MTIDLTNFTNSLDDYQVRAEACLRRAVKKFAEHVLGIAAANAPVKTGYLKGSQEVEEPVSVGDQITCILGFTADYAVFVHEILTNHHDQGEAKFLEKAMQEYAADLVPFVQQEYEAEFGK